jgi:hypothetical protein
MNLLVQEMVSSLSWNIVIFFGGLIFFWLMKSLSWYEETKWIQAMFQNFIKNVQWMYFKLNVKVQGLELFNLLLKIMVKLEWR